MHDHELLCFRYASRCGRIWAVEPDTDNNEELAMTNSVCRVPPSTSSDWILRCLFFCVCVFLCMQTRYIHINSARYISCETTKQYASCTGFRIWYFLNLLTSCRQVFLFIYSFFLLNHCTNHWTLHRELFCSWDRLHLVYHQDNSTWLHKLRYASQRKF